VHIPSNCAKAVGLVSDSSSPEQAFYEKKELYCFYTLALVFVNYLSVTVKQFHVSFKDRKGTKLKKEKEEMSTFGVMDKPVFGYDLRPYAGPDPAHPTQ
jgi:hypothetical protein